WKNAPGPQRDLPGNWAQIVADARERAGGRCEMSLPSGKRCPRPGREAHHYGRPDEHDKVMWICTRHHQIETQKQAISARTKKPVIRKQRHPGALPPQTGV